MIQKQKYQIQKSHQPEELIRLPEKYLSSIAEGQKDLQEGQKYIHKDLRKGFLVVAIQNQKLAEKLAIHNEELKEQNQILLGKLESVVSELENLKGERERKEALRNARAKRKRLPKRQPITPEIYQLLIQSVKGISYKTARLRIALCLLAITGVRINELLPLKFHQLNTLINFGWIKIDRSKRGPSSHKANLTPEGKRLLKERSKDFELMYILKNHDSYIFTAEFNHDRILRRESLTREVNKLLRTVSEAIPDKPNITSHSFRTGYITNLWKKTNDIELVKQIIGHAKIDSTSSYVQNLTEEELQKRISNIK